MKTIIVPLDFSNEALPGLNMSLIIANKAGANVLMVNVVAKNENHDGGYLQKEHDAAIEKFEEILRQYKSKINSNLSLSYTIKEGKVFREINNLAESFEDSLIVMSTHGGSGFEELFIGGHAYKITAHSKVPVITVRRSKTISNFDKIVLPVDFTFQTREKVPFTIELAKLFNSEVHLVSIRKSNIDGVEKKIREYVKQVALFLDYHKINYKIEHLYGNNLTDITLDYADKVEADLISIMTEQETSISNLLLGSYAHQMINKSFIPVLSFPNYQLQITTEDIWDLGAFNERN